MEVYDLSFSLKTYVEPIQIAGLNVVKFSGFMHPTHPIWDKYDVVDTMVLK